MTQGQTAYGSVQRPPARSTRGRPVESKDRRGTPNVGDSDDGGGSDKRASPGFLLRSTLPSM